EEITKRFIDPDAMPRWRSKGVRADDLAVALRPDRPPDVPVNRVLDEPNAAVPEEDVDPARVVAVRFTERRGRARGGAAAIGPLGRIGQGDGLDHREGDGAVTPGLPSLVVDRARPRL